MVVTFVNWLLHALANSYGNLKDSVEISFSTNLYFSLTWKRTEDRDRTRVRTSILTFPLHQGHYERISKRLSNQEVCPENTQALTILSIYLYVYTQAHTQSQLQKK